MSLEKQPPRCGGDPNLKEETIELISDCDILLVSQIGPGAQKKLINRGVRPLIMPVFIEDALEKLYSVLQNG
ncbi:dinitrogenase iron-molybdenum cofactor biosynthesis protein [Methanobacterium formicicum DSM 3637]|uniref:Dinitrogenase iron-molybdenum cofactor biosynthesis protein n=1 Tax=Methanobacterium formicicum (strain DSM 3637 / PP1) TaxID=1204725 RepID=K2R1E8_METFP|nr:dinitrogenase iron-molybdenum cofactor biosynthesis protein [Methanobacterium formicicum DSM 3637]